jgi:uncharacterized coiled-coil protein SlyX
MFDILEDFFCESLGKAIDGTGKLLNLVDSNHWNDDDDDDKDERRARRRKHALDAEYSRRERAYDLEQTRLRLDVEERKIKELKRERTALKAELAQQESLMRDYTNRLDQLWQFKASLGRLSFRRWGLSREIKAVLMLQAGLESQVASLRSGLSELGHAIKEHKSSVKRLSESMNGLDNLFW